MTKRLRVLGNQRIDLEDFLHGGSGFTVAELKVHVQQLLSELSGVLEGFDVALDGAPGTATNVIRIYNGAALDPTLQLVHVEDAPGTVVRLALEGAGLHHIGVVFRLVPSDTAARYFWDPTAANPNGTTGREFTQEVRTRFSVTWHVVTTLDDPSFASAGEEARLVIPLAVIPVIATAGPSRIDESRLRTEPAIGKLLRIDASDPARTRLRLVSAKLFRAGSALSVPVSPNAYSIDAVDPVRNELLVSPPLDAADQARALGIGFVTNSAPALPAATWGYRFVRSRGRLADPDVPGDTSVPGDVRPRLFEGDAARGARLLVRPRDDQSAPGERFTGRDEDALGTLKNLRDALAFVVAEAKFGERESVGTPRWIDPVPVPLWDLARLYFNELNGTGVVSGGVPTALELSPGATPGTWTVRVTFPETVYYASGIRHVMPARQESESLALTPAAGVLYEYWWASPEPNPNDPALPLCGPDWPTASTRIRPTRGADVFHPDPPPPTPRAVLLGAARFDNRAGGVLPTTTLIPMARVPRRVPDLFGFDAEGRLQRDLIFRTWADLGDAGRRITVDDPHGRLHIDVGTGALVVHAGGVVSLLADFPGARGAVQARQAGPGSPIVVQLDRTGLDLVGGAGVHLWDTELRARGELRARLGMASDRGGGLRNVGRAASLVGLSGDPAVAGALRLDAADGHDQDGWSDGTVAVDAQVLEVRHRLRLMGQAAIINVDRDPWGNPRGDTRGFNFINPYKVPLAWAYLAYAAGLFSLQAQSYCLDADGGQGSTRAEPKWLAPFGRPVAPTPPLVEVIGPSSSEGAVYGVQLPWASWFRPTAPSRYIVTLSVTPRYRQWRTFSMISARWRRPYNELPGFCSSSDVAWVGFGRDLTFRSGETLRAAEGPLLVYTYPSAYFDGIEGVMVQVWGALAEPVDPADPVRKLIASV